MKKKDELKFFEGLKLDVSDETYNQVMIRQHSAALRNPFIALIFGILIYLAPFSWLSITFAVLTGWFLLKTFFSLGWMLIYKRLKEKADQANP